MLTRNPEKQPAENTAGIVGGQNYKYSQGPETLKQPKAKNLKTAGGQEAKKQKTAGRQKHNKINVNKVNVNKVNVKVKVNKVNVKVIVNKVYVKVNANKQPAPLQWL